MPQNAGYTLFWMEVSTCANMRAMPIRISSPMKLSFPSNIPREITTNVKSKLD